MQSWRAVAVAVFGAILIAGVAFTAGRATGDGDADGRSRAEPLATPDATRSSPVIQQSDDAMRLQLFAWAGARELVAFEVSALIDDTVCASASSPALTSTDGAPFGAGLRIPAASEKSGCGEPGATVRFLVDGQPANETAIWFPGVTAPLTLSTGPPFARYSGVYRRTLDSDRNSHYIVEATIEGVPCGEQLNAGRGEGPDWHYYIVVPPDELRPGCGRPDVTVALRLVRVSGSDQRQSATDLVVATVPWVPGGSVELPTTDLRSHEAPGTPVP